MCAQLKMKLIVSNVAISNSVNPQKWPQRGLTCEVFSERRSVEPVIIVHLRRTYRGAPFTVHVSLPLLTLLPVTIETKTSNVEPNTSTMGDILISQKISGFYLNFKLFDCKKIFHLKLEWCFMWWINMKRNVFTECLTGYEGFIS